MPAIFKRFFALALSMTLLCSATVTSYAAAPSPSKSVAPNLTTCDTPTELDQADIPVLVKRNQYAAIDYSHAHEGYIKVKCTAQTDEDVSVHVYKNNFTVYSSPLPSGTDWITLSLTAGDGHYTIRVREGSTDAYGPTLLCVDLDAVISAPAPFVSNGYAVVDTSATGDGTVRIKYTASTDNEVSVKLNFTQDTQRYCVHKVTLTPGEWTTLPLNAGNGSYTALVLECVEGRSLTRLRSDFDVTIDTTPDSYLTSHLLIDYEHAPSAVALAESITSGCATDKEKVEIIYNYVADSISYDYEGYDYYPNDYIADLDAVLTSGKGICGHYAAVMCGMLRSLDIPAKMEYGYVSSGGYHAWVDVYFPDTGWVRYDPTFLSTADNVSFVMSYISNDANYRVCEIF